MNIRKDKLLVKCHETYCPHHHNCCKLVTEVVYARDSDNIIDVIIVGQGGGLTESKTGSPFTGISGKYLRSIIKHMWSDKTFNLALSNTVRCRPTTTSTVNNKVIEKDREPTKEEVNFCISNLWKDIRLLNPKAIVTVGKSATTSLVGPSSATMTSIRGKRYSVGGFDLIATWHPAYLTRAYGKFNPLEKHKEDLEVIEDITTSLTFHLTSPQPSLDLTV